jgi:hypothetical protein
MVKEILGLDLLLFKGLKINLEKIKIKISNRLETRKVLMGEKICIKDYS